MADVQTGRCIDCNEPCAGLRCRAHHTAFLRAQSLAETAEGDRELLDMVERQKLSYSRIAVRLGVSRPRVQQKVANARRRETAREVTAMVEAPDIR